MAQPMRDDEWEELQELLKGDFHDCAIRPDEWEELRKELDEMDLPPRPELSAEKERQARRAVRKLAGSLTIYAHLVGEHSPEFQAFICKLNLIIDEFRRHRPVSTPGDSA
jgi:hypothetical protein